MNYIASAAGTETGTLAITPSVGAPQTVSLTGTGLAKIVVTPETLTFPATMVGGTTGYQRVGVLNRTGVPISTTHSATGDFADYADNCPASLPVFNGCYIFVRFNPTAGGTRTGALTITPSVGDPQTVNLSGTATSNLLTIGTFTPADPTSDANINLTAEGTADWVLFAPDDAFDSVSARKTGVVQRISDYKSVDENPYYRACGYPLVFDYQDGIPHSTQKNVDCALTVGTTGSGFELTVKADTTPRTLRLYVGLQNGRGKLTAMMSDDSIPFTAAPLESFDSFENRSGYYAITFHAASAGQTLTLRWVADELYCTNDICRSPELEFYAATLDGAPIATPFLITDVTPASGPVGAHVAITGAGFGDAQGSVTIGNTPMTIRAWTDTRIDATVSDGTETGTLTVQRGTESVDGPLFTIYKLGGNPISGYHVDPSIFSMQVGESRTISVMDWNGRPVTGLPWTVTKPDIVSLSSDDPPLITALAPGTAIVYAADVPIEITGFESIWSPPSGTNVNSLMPAAPNSHGINVLLKTDAGVLYGLTETGNVAWNAEIGDAIAVPDFNGAALATFRYPYVDADGNRRETHVLKQVNPISGQVSDLYTYQEDTVGAAPVRTEVAIPTPAGVVFIQDRDKVVLARQSTGEILASIVLEQSRLDTVDNLYGNSTEFPHPIYGSMIVAGDGNAYLPYAYNVINTVWEWKGCDVLPYPCYWDLTAHQVTFPTVLRISSDGTSTNIPLETMTWEEQYRGIFKYRTGSGKYLKKPPFAITNADAGAAVVFPKLECEAGSDCSYPQMAIVSQDSVLSQVDTSPFVPVLQRGDGTYVGNLYNTVPANRYVAAYGQDGQRLWYHVFDDAALPRYATADGGVIVASENMLYTLDKVGNLVSQTADTRAIPGWNGEWYNFSGGALVKAAAPLNWDFSFQAFYQGNPAENRNSILVTKFEKEITFDNADSTAPPQTQVVPLEGIALGKTATILVSPTPSTPTEVTLVLEDAGDDGSAIFVNDSSAPAAISDGGKKATLQLGPNNPGKIKVKGVKVSKNADNIKIAVMNKKGQALPPGQKFSVVSVSITLHTDSISDYDLRIDAYYRATKGTKLGKITIPFTGSTPGNSGCSLGGEFRGEVTPSDYKGKVTLRRELILRTKYDGADSTIPISLGPQDDTSDPGFLTKLVQRDGQNGFVFDLDAPGPKPGFEVQRYRGNFRQYAQLGDWSRNDPVSSSEQASPDFFWFARASCKLNNNFTYKFIEPEDIDGVDGDNSINGAEGPRSAGRNCTPTTADLTGNCN